MIALSGTRFEDGTILRKLAHELPGVMRAEIIVDLEFVTDRWTGFLPPNAFHYGRRANLLCSLPDLLKREVFEQFVDARIRCVEFIKFLLNGFLAAGHNLKYGGNRFRL